MASRHRKSKLWMWTKRKSKLVLKKAWVAYRKSAKARKAQRLKARVMPTPTSSDSIVRAKRQSFLARHPILADVKDGISLRGHSYFDRRDIRSGVVTQEELDALENFDGPEEWRAEMIRRRREGYRTQQSRNRDIDYGPLAMVYGGGRTAGLPRVRHVGFRPPVARPSTVIRPSSRPPWGPPQRRKISTVRRKRKDRVNQLVSQWKPALISNARIAMAADGNLSGALDLVRAFAEQFPETRTQIHAHLGKLAEFGKGFAESMEMFTVTLAQGINEDNPGLPAEVINHLNPLTEIGDEIQRACQATLAAWEDYFANAIRAAQDEHTPSKAALTS